MIDVTDLLADKMLVLPRLENIQDRKSGKITSRFCNSAIHCLDEKSFKKMQVRRGVQLCKPLSITKHADTTLRNNTPETIKIRRKAQDQNLFKLNLVTMSIQDAKSETKKREYGYLRLPMDKKGIDSLYKTVIESLSRDLYYMFAEPKMQENMSKSKSDCVAREIKMDIINFVNSFDAIEIVSDEIVPQIFSYKGFEQFGLDDDCDYAHYYVYFYRLSEDDLVDCDTRERLLKMIESEKNKKTRVNDESEQ